jgi:hypothetical protein
MPQVGFEPKIPALERANRVLASSCLAMDVYSDFTILTFSRHVTIFYCLETLEPQDSRCPGRHSNQASPENESVER